MIFSLLISNGINAQKLKEYKASNGITYKKGDEITMSKGTGHDDTYMYLWISGGGKINTVAYNGIKVTIKKIKRFKNKRGEKILFSVGGGNIINYTLDIESAIEYCEIKNCKEKSTDITENKSNKYEKLKKLKELLDSGIITQSEFDKEKKKILESDE